ncbi:MAG: helix-turn-helix transcriptional regulator [Bacteroidia bacterium]|nr:helix-turn-helix transcriptional regulator [Bacteroidia bacterium]
MFEQLSEEFIEALQRQFGKRLRAQRKKLKLSQTDFAIKVGMSRGSIANFELGLGNPPLILVYSLAYKCGCEISDLIPTMTDVYKDEIFIEKLVQSELKRNTDLDFQSILSIINKLK